MSASAATQARVNAIIDKVQTVDDALQVISEAIARISDAGQYIADGYLLGSVPAAARSLLEQKLDFCVRVANELLSLPLGPLPAAQRAKVRLALLQTADSIETLAVQTKGGKFAELVGEMLSAAERIVKGAAAVAAPIALPLGALAAVAAGIYLFLRFGGSPT